MIRFDGKTFNDEVEMKRYCLAKLADANDGDYQARQKYDLDFDADQDWMWSR